jgi:predicted patatin/cPLA2 family phospholipase
MARRRLLRSCLPLVALCIVATGCSHPMPRTCVPPQLALSPVVDLSSPGGDPGMGDPDILCSVKQALEREHPARPNVPVTEDNRPLNVLALSGGGIYGAFDVGVLAGWSATGTRPVFDVVTGVSTGGLIATFAFLGPEYDEFLRHSYVNISSNDIYYRLRLLEILRSDSIASSVPLQRKVMAAITPEVLAAVAREHAKGRRLYVGTTNLDTRRFVVWDLGAIAAQGTPDALQLYQKIVLASASVPGFFQPVTINVEFNGQSFQEMHVDGGASASVFVRASMLRLKGNDPRIRAGSKIYVISSGKLFADPECVQSGLRSISSAAIQSLLYTGTRNDIYRIHDLALATGSQFRLIAVPPEMPLNPNSLNVDRLEMERLFETGYQMGLTGQGWLDAPPQLELECRPTNPPRTGVRFATAPPAP